MTQTYGSRSVKSGRGRDLCRQREGWCTLSSVISHTHATRPPDRHPDRDAEQAKTREGEHSTTCKNRSELCVRVQFAVRHSQVRKKHSEGVCPRGQGIRYAALRVGGARHFPTGKTSWSAECFTWEAGRRERSLHGGDRNHAPRRPPDLCTRTGRETSRSRKDFDPKTHDPGAQERRLCAYFTADGPRQVGS